jgi:hypothetical protein
MDQLVNWGNGTIATPRHMLEAGKAEIRVVANFIRRSHSKPRRAVFVDLIGTQTGVEVSGYVARVKP